MADERYRHPSQFAGRYPGCVLDDAGNCSRWNHDHPPAEAVPPPDSGGVGTGAGEGATGQDIGTAWVTRSEDCPEAPAQAHPLGDIQSVTPGRIPPAYHEHDAAGCLDCDCNAAPWSSKTPCTCPVEDADTLAALDRLRRERDEHQWNALEMSREADQAERRAEDAEAAIEATRDLLDGWEHDGPDDPAVHLLIQRVREMLALQQRFEDGRTARPLPIHRTEAGPNCSTCDGGGCPDCTDPA